MIRTLSLVAVFCGLLTETALADTQTYSVMLGQRQLGKLSFEGQNGNETLHLTLDNAPLGIKNGTFEAVTRARGNKVAYLGMNRGSETRDIAIEREAGAVTAVAVTPASEMTEMSDPLKVPAGVSVPTEAFATLAKGETCPSPIAMYDGRRVVQITTTAISQDGAFVICDMSYRVILGPGYVSPFYFKSFGMQLAYAARTLVRVTMSGGGISVDLIRQ